MKEAKKDANFYIDGLNLKAKKHVASTALSGGYEKKTASSNGSHWTYKSRFHFKI